MRIRLLKPAELVGHRDDSGKHVNLLTQHRLGLTVQRCLGRESRAVEVLVMVQHDRGSGRFDIAARQLVADVHVILPLPIGQIAGLLVALADLIGQARHADVREHRADAEVVNLLGGVGRQTLSLTDQIPVQLQPHQQTHVRHRAASFEQ